MSKTIHEASIEELEAAIVQKKFLKEMAERPKRLEKPNFIPLICALEQELQKANSVDELLL